MGQSDFVPIKAGYHDDLPPSDMEHQYKAHDHMGDDALAMDPASVKPRRHRCCCGWQVWLCWLGVVLAVLLMLIGIGVLVVACTFKTVPPEISVDKIDIVSMAVGKEGGLFDLANLQLNMNALINITATVYNPNKFDVKVNYVNMVIQFFGMGVSNTSLPEFWLYKQQNHTTTVSFPINDFPIISTGGGSFLEDAFTARRLQMRLFVDSKGMVKLWGISSPTYKVGVICNATVNPAGGKLFSKKCLTKTKPA